MNFFENNASSFYNSSSLDSFHNVNDNALSLTDLNVSVITQAPRSSGGSAPLISSGMRILQTIQWGLSYIVMPIICILGMMGNITSIILITRDSLRKSSNILLVALAINDFLVLFANMYRMVYLRINDPFISYSKGVSHFFIYMYIISTAALNIGVQCSYSCAVYITLERLCAIFSPLKFHLIITPFRTFMVLFATWFFYGSYAIAVQCGYKPSPPFVFRGIAFYSLDRTEFFFKFKPISDVMTKIIGELTGTVVISILIVGSIVIGYKVQMAARRRAKMTTTTTAQSAGQAGQPKGKGNISLSRTTRTLLAVCATFSILAGLGHIVDYVQTRVRMTYPRRLLLATINELLASINSSCNFLIYIFNNNKFKNQLLAMFASGEKAVLLRGRGTLNTVYRKEAN